MQDLSPDTAALESILAAFQSHPNIRVLRRLPISPLPDINPQATPEQKGSWKRAIILDTETTGLDTKTAKVIELGLTSIYYDAADQLANFGETRHWFEDPGEPLSAETKKVTGITDEMIAGKKIDDEEVASFISDATIIIAHKADYDRPIVERRFGSWAIEKNWACSIEDVDWKEYGAPSSNLQCIAWAAGTFFDGHRAANDTAALAYLLGCVRMGSRSALSDLLMKARKPMIRILALGAPFDKKDALKLRGYSWNVDRKVWWIDKAMGVDADNEESWLSLNVLRGGNPGGSNVKRTDMFTDRA